MKHSTSFTSSSETLIRTTTN